MATTHPDNGYKHTSNTDVKAFYTCLNALIGYVSAALEMGAPGIQPLIDAHEEQRRTLATRVLDLIWEHPTIVRDYVELNPDKLAPWQLNIIAPWEHALCDVFLCLENDYGTITCANSERLFEVGSLATPIETLVGNMPAMAILTLLPYQGRLVCDGRVTHISNHPRQEAAALIDSQLARAGELPLIRTPAELVAYSSARECYPF